MQQPLEAFIRALRAAEVRVSVAEAIDANLVAARIGFSDRQLLKDALGMAMAKTVAEKTRFAETFDLFFARQEFAAAEAASAQLPPEERPDTDLPLADMLLDGDGQALAAAMEAAANAVEVGNIRFFTQRGYFARRMLDRMGLRELEQMIAAVDRGQVEGGAQLGQALTQGRQRLLTEARAFVERQYELYARAAGEQLREEFLEQTRFTQIDPRDYERMRHIVRRMARKLADRYLQRHKRSRRGQLDVRRTLRASMPHGGIPFEAFWKQKKVERPKVVAICDVSGSVAAAARFLLMFLYSLNEVLSQVRSFAFSGNLVEISEELENHEVEEAIPAVLAKIGFRPTDYGRSFEDLKRDYFDAIDRHTTVIILGDGRSNYGNPRVEILKTIYQRSRRLVWLNPEPEVAWGSGDSEMLRYRPHCHVAKSCNTIKELERVIDDILRSTSRA